MNEPRYRIGTLARLTGVTTHAIRIWERRYQALSPSRTPGGARLYSDLDVQRLRLVKKLLDRGYTISALAKLDLGELMRLAPPEALPARPTISPEAQRRAYGMIKKAFAANGIRFALPTVSVAGGGDATPAVAQQAVEMTRPPTAAE